jgi:MFS family permease
MVRTVAGWYRRAYEGLPREIWIISLALFVNRFGTMVLPFLSLYLTTELGYGEAEVGRLLSVYGMGSIAGVYFAGHLIRPIGTIRLQILLFVLACPSFLFVPLFRSYWGIAIALFLLAAITDGVRPANNMAISHFAPRDLRVRAFGLQRMALNLGISFGPAIGGVLATYSFVWLFYVDGATSLLCGAVLLGYFGRTREPRIDARDTTATPGSLSTSSSPLRDGPFVMFLLLLLATSIVFFQFHTTYPLYLTQHYGLTKPVLGRVYAVNTVVIVLVEMLLLQVVRRWSLLSVIAAGAALSCFGFGMLAYGKSVSYAVLSMLVITLGEMLWMPLAAGWVAQRGEMGDAGKYMSWYTVNYSVAAMIAPAIGGVLYEQSPHTVWYVAQGLSVVVFIGFTSLRYAISHRASYSAAA